MLFDGPYQIFWSSFSAMGHFGFLIPEATATTAAAGVGRPRLGHRLAAASLVIVSINTFTNTRAHTRADSNNFYIENCMRDGNDDPVSETSCSGHPTFV